MTTPSVLDFPKVDVLGVHVSAINMQIALDVLAHWIETGAREYVTVTGVHGVMESQRDPDLLEIHNRAGMVTPDGMPMVWLARQAGHEVTRVYGPDLLLAMSSIAVEKGYSFYFYGGKDGVADELARRLQSRFPGLRVAGTYCPPFRPLSADEIKSVADRINQSGADIVWVGLSTPKQERWIAENRSRLNPPVLIGVGAAFDFHSGQKRQAPRWMRRTGLEWLFRLLQEPRRLGRRYLEANSRFIYQMARAYLGRTP